MSLRQRLVDGLRVSPAPQGASVAFAVAALRQRLVSILRTSPGPQGARLETTSIFRQRFVSGLRYLPGGQVSASSSPPLGISVLIASALVAHQELPELHVARCHL